MTIILTALAFLVIFSLVVMFHELGHFLASKLQGIEVEEFGFGFPPRLWGKKIGKTLYSVNALPIGGFVKIHGEDESVTGHHDPTSFWHQSPRKRLLVLTAGVIANFILGAGLYYVALGFNDFKSTPIFLFSEYKFPFGQEQLVSTLITGVADGSPASKAGLVPGDLITAVDGQAVTSSNLLNEFVNTKKDQPQILTIENLSTGDKHPVTVAAYYDTEYNKWRFGLELGEVAFLTYQKHLDKAFAGFEHSVNVVFYTVKTLSDLVSLSFTTRSFAPVTDNVTGPVGLAQVVSLLVTSSGNRLFWNLLEMTALLSLALGISNILPIPAMDGGHVAFVVYEIIFRRKPNKRFQEAVTKWGFYGLIGLSLLIAFKDIRNWL